MAQKIFRRVVAFVLAIITLIPVVSLPKASANAYVEDEEDLRIKVLKASLNGEVMEHDGGCWLEIPKGMYGQSAIAGNGMHLNYRAGIQGMDGHIIGTMIFKGKPSDLSTKSKAVFTDLEVAYDHPDSLCGCTWDTKGCSAGDYTAVHFLWDINHNQVVASKTVDLYLSKKRIPMTGLAFYIRELDRIADEITIGKDRQFCYDVIFYPYHTTDPRMVETDYTFENSEPYEGTPSFSHSTCAFPASNNLIAPDVAGHGTYTITQYIGENPVSKSLSITVTDAPWTKIPWQEENLCLGSERTFRFSAPKGQQVRVYSPLDKCLEIVGVTEDSFTVRAKRYGSEFVVVQAGDTWDSISLEVKKEHRWLMDETVDATCQQEGYKRYKCQFCGEEKTEVIPKRPHAYGPMVVVKEFTATKDGLEKMTCITCGYESLQIVDSVFDDTDENAYYSDAVDYWYEKKIMSGVEKHLFAPSKAITRGMLVALLYRYAGRPEPKTSSGFEDVPGDVYYTKAVDWAYENGYVMGVSQREFQPGEEITRQDLASILYRYAKKNGLLNDQRADLSVFTDEDEISGYARKAISWAYANRIIVGVSKTEFEPESSASRAQSAAILYRMLIRDAVK